MLTQKSEDPIRFLFLFSKSTGTVQTVSNINKTDLFLFISLFVNSGIEFNTSITQTQGSQ